MILAFPLFLCSLLGIAGLFALKEWESRRDRVVFPALRRAMDAHTLRLVELLVALQADIEKLPPEIAHASRLAVQESALAAASLLRFLSVQAHALADLVSHKHAFKRRAPRSEFLKKVIEHKNGGGERNE